MHELGLRQSTYFEASCVSQKVRDGWIKSRSQSKYREPGKSKTIKDHDLLVVTSQNCDIGSRSDTIDTGVELAVFKPIKDRAAHPGNQYIKSVKKLQIQIQGCWYEAKVEHLVTIEKNELLDLSRGLKLVDIPSEDSNLIPLWRSNRYLRTALPDKFDINLKPHLDNLLPELDQLAMDDDGASYIRAIYIWLNSYEELKAYEFDVFALLRSDTPNEKLSCIQDQIEALAESLEQGAGYTLHQDAIFADRDSNTYVSYLTKFSKLNLDPESLAAGDEDTGPKA